MTTLFVSDLHLHPSRPAISALFLAFLRSEAAEAEAVYILGDLFEAWVGDDSDDAISQLVRSALRELVARGVPVFVMRGNRDFLYGWRFAADTGVTLLADPSVIVLYGQPTLLMHGDLLCSDDRDYLAFRQQVRNRDWQEAFLSQSMAARLGFAESARAGSLERQTGLVAAGALESITDANCDTVVQVMEQFGVSKLIHGHTHRPAIHRLECAGRPAHRIVLGDWYEQGSVLRASQDGFELSTLS